jgi:hypothetical protein
VKAILSAMLLLCAALCGQDETFVAPPAPEDRLFEDSRVLVRDPARRQAIVEALAALEEKHGFRMYCALYDSLIGSTPADRARELQAAWLGRQPGMVLVLETDSRVFQVGQAPPESREIEPGSRLELAGPADLSPSDLAALIAGLEVPLREARDSAAFAETLSVGMARAVSTVLDERAARPEGDGKARMIVLAIGLIAAVGLGALLVVAGLKRAEARSQERYVFPKVHVGTRLGAPYGGGKISARSFGAKDKA